MFLIGIFFVVVIVFMGGFEVLLEIFKIIIYYFEGWCLECIVWFMEEFGMLYEFVFVCGDFVVFMVKICEVNFDVLMVLMVIFGD